MSMDDHWRSAKESVCYFVFFILSFFGVVVPLEYVQGSEMTLTITPPIFQIALQPGETWTSGVRIVNSNLYPVTVYADPVSFTADGKTGRPVFQAREVAPDGTVPPPDQNTLAGWITVPQTGISIPAEGEYILPLAVSVPFDAPPGGHYASVLITTGPPTVRTEESTVAVTSSIATLLFVRVAGEVKEEGMIRAFMTGRFLYEAPHAVFTLRFENKGNTHLQPQGDIAIYNMFGKKRGYIPVNHTAGYGMVLPGSTREFIYEWETDMGGWDVGRYRAKATIGFGTEVKSFVTAEATFWVLPLRKIALAGVVLFFSLWFIGWALRAYVRHALMLERVRLQSKQETVSNTTKARFTPSNTFRTSVPAHTKPYTLRTFVRPLTTGLVDLRTKETQQVRDGASVRTNLISRFRIGALTALFLCACTIVVYFVSVYVHEVQVSERTFRSEEQRVDVERSL